MSQVLSGHCLLHGRGHRWGSAKEDARVLSGSRCGKLLLDHILGDISNTTIPLLRCMNQNVVNIESATVSSRKLVQFKFEEDIFLGVVGVDQVDASGVFGVVEDIGDDLVHGGDTSSTADHSEFASHAHGVLELTLGTFDTDAITNFEVTDVPGDVSLFIGLQSIR